MHTNWSELVELMSLREWEGLVFVALGSLALWGAFFVLLGRRVWRLFAGGAATTTPHHRRFHLIVYALCALYAATFAYARYIEPQKLVLKRLVIQSAKLPPGTTLRIAHVSDLHAQAHRQPQLERAAEAVVDLHPDLVVMTGDYLCDFTHGAPTALLAFLLRLPDVPTYAVPGNYGGRLPADAFFETLGIEILHTETRLFSVRGVPIELHGASPRRKAMQLKPRLAPERLGIFLQHFPSLLPSAVAAGFDLYLAGHTHGGQVRIPGYGAIVTLDRLGKTFEMGAYQVGDTTGFINAGVGMECRWAPQVRLFCPPEIALIEIRGP